MSEVIHLDDLKPHFNVLALCLACGPENTEYKHHQRWIATVTARTSLFALECPRCGEQDSFAAFIPHEYTEAMLKEFPND